MAHKAAQFDFLFEHGLKRIAAVYAAHHNRLQAKYDALAAKHQAVTKSAPKADGRPGSTDTGTPSYDQMTAEEGAEHLSFG